MTFGAEERRALAVKAVNRLIANVEAERLPEKKELAEAIAACICETGEHQLHTLRFLLGQQELERPDLESQGFIR